jgi:16S rRNA (guanine(966)-N(2))-methyltransferase RsmD
MPLVVAGGRFQGTRLKTPSGQGVTRPTSGKTRQALFNILRDRLEGADFLDLYAGSGAVGLEAYSRGCRTCTLVENHGAAWKCLEENCRLLESRGAVAAALIRRREEAERFCLRARSEGLAFGAVFADPPFADPFPDLPAFALPLLAPGGAAVFQFPTRRPPAFVAAADRVYAYGESSLALFTPP